MAKINYATLLERYQKNLQKKPGFESYDQTALYTINRGKGIVFISVGEKCRVFVDIQAPVGGQGLFRGHKSAVEWILCRLGGIGSAILGITDSLDDVLTLQCEI